MEDVAKELQITIDIEFTVDFGHALPLCIMSTRKIFKSWLYDNYMKPLICYAGLERFDCLIIDSMQYGYLSKIPASMMRYSFVGDDILMHVDDIVKLVKQRIGKGWYCVLFLDFYYIRGMYSYQTSHFAHEVLIYGYDDTKQMISAIVFYNTLKRIYISYEDLKKAYKDVFECIKERPGWNEYMLLEFKPIDVHKKAYPSEVESLVTKIKYYLSSQMSEEDYYKEFIYMNWGKKECYPGIKMNKAVLKLARELKDRFMNLGESCEKYTLFGQYHPLHSYSEFHKGLFARIRYFVSDNEYYDINNQVLIAYKEVVELCEKIRLCYMKIGVLKNRKKDTEIINTLNSIISYAEAVYRREPVILGRIIGLLEHAHV